MIERLTNAETVAKITFAMAIMLAVVASMLLVALKLRYNLLVEWNGEVTLIKGNYGVVTSLSPFNRPSVVFFSPDRTVSLQILSFNDVLSFYNGERVGTTFVPKIYVNNSKVTIDYGKFKKVIYFSGNEVVIELDGFRRGVLGFSVIGMEDMKWNSSTIELVGVEAPLGVKFNVTLAFKGCRVEPFRELPLSGVVGTNYVVQAQLDCKDKAYLSVKASAPKSPLLGKVLLYALDFSVYLLPLWAALVGLVVWKLWLSKNLKSFKGAAVFALILVVISGLSAHHWDMLMAYMFGKLTYHLEDPYRWTYENSMFLRAHVPVPNAFFPGYAYFPQLLIFFIPLYLLYKTLIRDEYFITIMPKAVELANQYSILFKSNAFVYYVLAHGYYFSFIFLTAYLISKYYNRERAFLFLYSFLPLTIIIEWGMYECFMLPFFVLSLRYLRKEGRADQALSGLLWSLGSAKIYPLLSVPALLAYSKDRLSWLGGFLLAQLPSLYFLLKEPLYFLSCTVLFHLNRNIGDINYFPSFLGNPLSLLWLGRVGSAVEMALLILTYYLIWKTRPEKPETAAALPLVPFLLFNRLVSPQHHLTFGTLALLSGEALTFAYLGVLVFLHVNLIRPTVLYLAYHWLEIAFTRRYFAYGSSAFLMEFMIKILPSFVWPFTFSAIAGTLALYYVKGLRRERCYEGAGKG